MQVINFSHPLTSEQIAQIEGQLGRSVDDTRNVRVQLDLNQPFVPQVVDLVDSLGITAEQWQTGNFLFVLPALSAAAAIVVAELHGRTGYFPAIVRLRPVPDALVTTFEVAEIVGLGSVRHKAREMR